MPELEALLPLFGLAPPEDARLVDSSRGEGDRRLAWILERRFVLRAGNAGVLTEERVRELNGLVERLRAFGLRAPAYLTGRNGAFLQRWAGWEVTLTEYLDLATVEGPTEALCDARLRLVGSFAARYRGVALSPVRSMYSLFALSPYDVPFGVDEKEQNLRELANALRETGAAALAARLEGENARLRARLRALYPGLPECFFQGDENFSNLCVDEAGRLAGIFDFNMAGTDVAANTLANVAFQGRFRYEEAEFAKKSAEALFQETRRDFRRSAGILEECYPFSPPEREAFALCGKLAALAGYVNAAAFIYYLRREETREKARALLTLLMEEEL